MNFPFALREFLIHQLGIDIYEWDEGDIIF